MRNRNLQTRHSDSWPGIAMTLGSLIVAFRMLTFRVNQWLAMTMTGWIIGN